MKNYNANKMVTNKIISFIILINSFIISNYSVNAQSALQARKALLIGNKRYTSSRLPSLENTERDVDSMTVALTKMGFKISPYKNLDFESSKTVIQNFIDSLEPSDIAIVYFSGHGIGYQGNNYLMPIDANIECVEKLEKYEAISLNKLVDDLRKKRPSLSLIFLDACRNLPDLNTCGSIVKAEKVYIKPDGLPGGYMVAYATSDGNAADDGRYDQVNSLFTSELIKYLPKPNLGIREILDLTKKGVIERSAGKQNPQRADGLFSNYAFIGKVSNVTVPRPSIEMTVLAYKIDGSTIDYDLTRMAINELRKSFPDYNFNYQPNQKGIVATVRNCVLTRKTSFRTAQTAGYEHIVAETELILLFKENGKTIDERIIVGTGTDSDKYKAEKFSIERALQQLSP